MKNLTNQTTRKILLGLVFFLSCLFMNAQGLINNGAHIEITNGAFVYIDGGAGIGNFVNQDDGVYTGTVENQGTIDVTGDWTNLSSSNVFNTSTGTTRLLGANQIIQGTASTYFNNLTLLGSGIKTLNIPTLTGGGFAIPTGVLNLTTLPLDLNGYKLTVNNPATTAVINTTGYIISETPAAINPSIVQWNMGATNGIYAYPFGVAGTQIPVTVNKTAGTGSVSVSTRATPSSNNSTWQATVTNMYSAVIGGPGEIPVVIDRWWDVDPSAPVTAMLSFTYRGSENTTTFNPTGTFSGQNWNGTQWLTPVGAGPGVLAGTASVVIPSQVLSTTPWVLSNLTAPLPVELISFVADCSNKNTIDISWITASESNNDYFTLEKSTNGTIYSFLTYVKGQGNSSHIQNYSFQDHNPFIDRNYYRLSQTNFDGQTEYLTPVSTPGCESKLTDELHAWASGKNIHILVHATENMSYNFSLFDAEGRLLLNESKKVESGTSEILIDRNNFSNGIYFLSLRNQSEILNYKILLSE